MGGLIIEGGAEHSGRLPLLALAERRSPRVYERERAQKNASNEPQYAILTFPDNFLSLSNLSQHTHTHTHTHAL